MSSTRGTLVPVDFHGDAIECIDDNGRLWVSVRAVCAALGLDNKGQQAKLSSKTWACVEIITTQVAGQRREVFCLDLDSLPMWLATIATSRVRPEIRPKLELYQRECARVLREHFLGPQRGAQGDMAQAVAAAVAPLVEAVARLGAAQQGAYDSLDARVRRLETMPQPQQQVLFTVQAAPPPAAQRDADLLDLTALAERMDLGRATLAQRLKRASWAWLAELGDRRRVGRTRLWVWAEVQRGLRNGGRV